MNPLDVGRWALGGSLALFGRWSHWKPFLLLGLVQAVFLAVLLSFYSSLFLPIALPLMRLLGGEGAVHYPFLYYLLPGMFQKGNMVINVLWASIVLASATVLFAAAFGYSTGTAGGVWRRAWRKAPSLMGAALIETLLQLGLMTLARLVPHRLFMEDAAVRWGTRAALLGLSILLQSMFVYVTAWIMLKDRSLFPAIRDSVRVTAKTFVPTIVVVALPALLMFPLSYIAGRADLIAEKFKPEMVGTLVGIQLGFQIVLTFLLVGAVTRLFVWRMEASR